MQPANTPIIIRPTRCKLCGHVFKGNPLQSAAVLGENDQAKIRHMQALISPIMKHLATKHPQELQWAQMQGGEWAGFLSMSFVQCDEPLVEGQRDHTRWKIHTMTQRAFVNDERIRERLEKTVRDTLQLPSHLGDDKRLVETEVAHFMATDLAKNIIEMMKQMRDVLDEKGRYDAPHMPGESTAAEPDLEPQTTA